MRDPDTPYDHLAAALGRELGSVQPDWSATPRYLSVELPRPRRVRVALVAAFAAATFLVGGGLIGAAASVGTPPPPAAGAGR